MKFAVFLGVLLLPLISSGQQFGNEWIEDYNQYYYKFPVVEEGIYRIHFSTLANAGIPASAINPANFQVFGRMAEIPIRIKGGDDGVFNSDDFIEFYATGNDGWLEENLYPQPEDQTNPSYSLFNDTLFYYLTWNASESNLRVQEETDNNFAAYSALPWIFRDVKQSFTANYYPGELDDFGVSVASYTAGEGWMSPRFGIPSGSGYFDAQIATPGVSQDLNAPAAKVTTISAGVSNASAVGYNHHLRISYGSGWTEAANLQFSGYEVNQTNFSIPLNHLQSGAVTIRHQVVNDLNLPADYQAVSSIDLSYPHKTDLQGAGYFSFSIPQNQQQQKTLVVLQNISGTNPVIYQHSGRRIELFNDNGNFKALVPNVLLEEVNRCLLVTEETVKSIAQLLPVANNGRFTNFGQANVDSAFIVISETSLMGAAEAYAVYRQQRFNSFAVNVEELYDQFGGGVRKSGIAIRNFANFLLNNWTHPPQYLFLMGKSVREAKEGNVAGSRQNSTYYAANLVPSLGFPSSDNYLTAGLVNTTLQPAIPTGRISVQSPQQAFDYLSKVQEFESQPPAEWMKNILHFGGGSIQSEQQAFANYLANYENIAEGLYFGADVTTFLKSSSTPIQINVSQELTNKIYNGTTLLTFFGHASSSGFDQSIDNPENLDWNGHYPLLLGISCYTGDIHSPGQSSTSEAYTLIPDKGVIAFLSSSKLGFVPYLNLYSEEFYRNFSRTNYGGSIGSHIKKTIENIQFYLGPEPNLFMANTCFGMTLQGDPSLVLNSFPKPDIKISEPDIYFTPAEITAETDSFRINIVLTNLAKAFSDTFLVSVEHFNPQQQLDSAYSVAVDGLYFKDTVSVTIPIDAQYGLGQHSFNVYADVPQNQIEELPGLEVSNNQVLGKQLVISSGGIVPVYPYEFSVVSQSQLELVASTGDPFAAQGKYVFQIDTTDVFNSPFLQQQTISSPGGVVKWDLPFVLADSTVYYWRVSELAEEPIWRQSSFQYIENKEGWGQAHIFQQAGNSFSQTEFDRPNREIDFYSGTVRLSNTVLGNNVSYANEILLNTEVVEYGACFGIPSIHMAVFDPITFEAWGTNSSGQNPDHDFGNANANGACRNRVENYFIFRQNNAAQMQALADVLTGSEIPDGYYVLLYTMRYADYDSWSATPAIFEAFEEAGAATIGQEWAQDSVPFTIFYRKGDPTFVHELYGTAINDTLNLVVDIPASGTRGAVSSPLIGPTSHWNSLHWRFKSSGAAGADSVRLQVTGYRSDGSSADFPELSFGSFSGDVFNLDEQIDAAEFPYLKLQLNLIDSINATPAQIDSWHVLYEETPEAALAPNISWLFHQPELQEGEPGSFSVAIENVSASNMDSLLVYYYIEDEKRERHYLSYGRQAPLAAGESFTDTLEFDTRGLAGKNKLWIEVNPTDTATGTYDQPEQYHFNNIAAVPFEVVPDKTNPILDVTFDGLHIINGEIVSAKPEIRISLKDENQFLVLNQPADTSHFKIFITTPQNVQQRVYFSSGVHQEIIFTPASGPGDKGEILYTPWFPEDGTYTLLIQATDKSGNNSGNTDYSIEFEVINKASITEVLNYPNPFSTRTQFVFTLTGSQIPDQIKIQIMTVSGKIVREIMGPELGPLRIGRNRTEYAWDGRDEFGDRLANGVYLYRVVARLNGQNLELGNTAAGKYFTRGFGKMVLLH